MLSRNCYRGIAVYLTFRKQSEYFGKRDIAIFLTCYIYSGDFSENNLSFDPINSYYHKELHHRLGKATKVYLFR